MQIEGELQSVIHKMEEGGGARYLRATALVLAVLALAMVFDLRAYRNFSTPEAMDSAQLARNIADGKGYTTLFIRPFSLYLVQRHNEAGVTNAGLDFAQIKTAHPDIANAPVYPVVLAGLMKVLPFRYPVELNKPFWSDNGKFSVYQPDFLIAMFNEILLLAVVVLTFLIARKLFDQTVAWFAALLTIGCDLLWKFSVSGLSTMLLLVIFLGLAWCVLKIEEAARDERPDARRLLLWVLAAGALTGVGALTRYSFGWAIIPLTVFLVLFSGQRRVLHAMVALVVFVLVLTPWIVRNCVVSGTPFGTAGFAAYEGTFLSQNFQLERSLHPDLSRVSWLTPYIYKLLGNLPGIVETDLPRLGGSWVTLLFLTGLLLGFRSIAVRRMRYFLLMCLGMFIVCQALGQTQLSVESPEVNSENLLVLLAPLVFIYGTSLFLTFLDQMDLSAAQLRYFVIAIFFAVSCLPMIAALCPPKTSPVVYPPYFPPKIQQAAGWMNQNELIMSDVPWAVAWYGQRQCVWLTLDWQNDFIDINKNLKPIQALYLTPKTMDGRFVTEWLEGNERGWGSFLIKVLTDQRVPDNFPLTKSPSGFFPEQLFLTDRERWPVAK